MDGNKSGGSKGRVAQLSDQHVLGELRVTAHLRRQGGGILRDKLEK